MSTSQAVSQSLYVVVGSCAFVCNTFVVYVIAKCKPLHFNAYFLAAALAAIDILGGLGFMLTGSYRLYVIFTNQSSLLIPPWECVYAPSINILAITFHAGSVMVFLIACDRLLAITAARFYFRLGKRYTASLIAICLISSALAGAYFFYDIVAGVPQVPKSNKFCYGIHSATAHAYEYYGETVFVDSSALIMIVAMIILRRQQKRLGPQNQQGTTNNAQAISKARNVKASKLLALILLNTISTWALPDILVNVIDSFGSGPASAFAKYAGFLFILQPTHATTNLFIYFRKGSPFRQAFAELKSQTKMIKMSGSGTT